MRPLILLTIVLYLAGCKNNIDINNIEARGHGLFYIKGTNELVDGKVSAISEYKKPASIQEYKNGKPIGPGYRFGYNGDTLSSGFGVDLKKYENVVNGLDLTYSYLYVTKGNSGDAGFVTVYVDNDIFFNKVDLCPSLAKAIFLDYSEKYDVQDMLIRKQGPSIKISRKAAFSNNAVRDTIADIIYLHDATEKFK